MFKKIKVGSYGELRKKLAFFDPKIVKEKGNFTWVCGRCMHSQNIYSNILFGLEYCFTNCNICGKKHHCIPYEKEQKLFKEKINE